MVIVAALLLASQAAHADDAPPPTATELPCCQLGQSACFLALDGVVVDQDSSYLALTERGEPHHVRAAIEMALALGAGTAWYWIDRDRQVADWDYPSWSQRLTLDIWRFDNNPFGINYIGHPLNGASFHALARANDLGLWGSVGYGLATSMAWEFLFEFREKISINDAIVTTGAGIALGELVHWLGRYVNSRPARRQGIGHAIARWTAGLTVAAHDFLNGNTRRTTVAADSLGFRSDIWHRFDISYSLARGDASARNGEGDDARLTIHAFRASARLIGLPGYLRPGHIGRWFGDANVTSLKVEALRSSRGSGVSFAADAILVGRHQQNLPASGAPTIGYALLAGPAIGYSYLRERFDPFEDRLALMHLPGPAADLVLAGRGWQARLQSRVAYDFVGIHAVSHDRWQSAHPEEVGKTILHKQGYYYGWGWSARAQLALSVPYAELGASIFYGAYGSQEGLDRSQESLTIDPHLEDTVLRHQAWLRLRRNRSGMYLELRSDSRRRRSSYAELDAAQDFHSLELGLGLEF